MNVHSTKHTNTFVTFSKQQPAIDLYNQLKPNNNDIKIFSKEINSHGTRSYSVVDCRHFYRKYKQMSTKDLCWYEVILLSETAKLYLDVEFDKTVNKNINGNTLLNILCAYIRKYIYKTLSIQICKKNIIDLDSTTASKYSRHLIIIFPDNIFENNTQAGIFVKNMMHYISQTADKSLKQMLNLKDKYGKPHKFVDPSVYSKNRCFRLIGSSKYKYIQIFQPIPLKWTAPIESSTLSFDAEYQLFIDTLITGELSNLKKQIIKLPMNKIHPNMLHLKQYNSRTHQISINTNNKQMQTAYKCVHKYITKIANSWHPNNIDVNRETLTMILKPKYKSNGYIANTIVKTNRYGAAINIYYTVNDNRFCLNIGREHKQNRIKFRVDCTEKKMYQCCFDIDCKNGFGSQISLDLPDKLFDFVFNASDFEKQMIASVDAVEEHIFEQQMIAFADTIELKHK
eukprot:180182_1